MEQLRPNLSSFRSCPQLRPLLTVKKQAGTPNVKKKKMAMTKPPPSFLHPSVLASLSLRPRILLSALLLAGCQTLSSIRVLFYSRKEAALLRAPH